MKKTITGIFVLLIAFVLVACIQPVSEVEEIEVIGLDTSGFVEGQPNADISDVDVVVTFADGTSQTLGIDEVTVTGSTGAFVAGQNYVLDMSSDGTYTLTISYGGVTVNINYVVAVPVLTADTSWYVGTSPFTISTAAGLAGLAALVNDGTDDFLGDVVNLGANIDLGNAPWTPIGTATQTPGGQGTITASFKGTFNGGNFTISNLKINEPFLSYRALFGVVQNATIQNLTLSGVNILGYEHIGGLVGRADGDSTLISNVNVNNATITGGHWVAGIIGYASSTSGRVENSTVELSELTAYVLDKQANGDKVASIIGYAPNYYVDNNTALNNVINVFRDGGGITGYQNTTTLGRVTNNHAENIVINLDKTQTENPNFKDGEKDANRYVGAIIGRHGDKVNDGPQQVVVDNGNTYTNVVTWIRLENETEFEQYDTKYIGAKLQSWYVLGTAIDGELTPTV